MLAQDRMMNLLEEVNDSAATIQFLKLCRMIINSFLNKATPVKDRIILMWHVTFFIRLWCYWLTKNNYKLGKHFVSSNVSSCIKLNAHSINFIIRKM